MEGDVNDGSEISQTTPCYDVGAYRIPLQRSHNFCEDPLFNFSMLNQDISFDFTLCFYSTVLVYVPSMYFMMLAFYKLYCWKKSGKTTAEINGFMELMEIHTKIQIAAENQSRQLLFVNWLQCVFQTFLLVISIGKLIWNVSCFWNNSYSFVDLVPIANVIEPAVNLLTWYIAVKVTLHEQNHLNKSKRMQILDVIFRVLTTLSATLTLISIIRFPEKRLYSYNVTYCVYFSLVSVSLIIETVNSYILLRG